MPYSKNNDNTREISELKKKLSEQMPDVDVDNLSTDDMKNLLLNEINNNKNINLDDNVKEKINNGDMDGLKEEIIKHLAKNKSADGSSEKIVKMLQNNDMDGLKNQVMGMLLNSIGQQKKNEIGEDDPKENSRAAGLFGDFDEKAFMDLLTNKVFSSAKNDHRIVFLNSMRPFLSDRRQQSIDDCLKILNIVVLFEQFVGKVGR